MIRASSLIGGLFLELRRWTQFMLLRRLDPRLRSRQPVSRTLKSRFYINGETNAICSADRL